MVDQSPGRRHQHVGPPLERPVILVDGDAPDDDRTADVAGFPKHFKHARRLLRQLPCRGKDQRLHVQRPGQPLDDRKRERRRFPRSRLCQADDVLPLQHQGNGLGLDRRGGHESGGVDVSDKALAEREIGELRRLRIFCQTLSSQCKMPAEKGSRALSRVRRALRKTRQRTLSERSANLAQRLSSAPDPLSCRAPCIGRPARAARRPSLVIVVWTNEPVRWAQARWAQSHQPRSNRSGPLPSQQSQAMLRFPANIPEHRTNCK